MSQLRKHCLKTFAACICLLIAAQAHAQDTVYSEDFSGGDGGYTVTNGIGAGEPAGPWVFSGASWSTDGGDGVVNSALDSPLIVALSDALITISFDHRYNFEDDGTTRWDAGQVRLSVNGGPFAPVQADAFSVNGYPTDRTIGGNSPPLNGQFAFNNTSAGFADGDFITSVANLGAFSTGDEITLRFIGAWDEGFIQTPAPNWEVDAIRLTTVTGDVDGNQVVDLMDFDIIRDNYLTGTTLAEGNLDAQGVTDFADFRLWKMAFEAAAPASVPEPSALALLVVAFGLAAGQSRLR